tara:strand:- start:942 stop:1151 length:210 start_codon:yes stop_codon:yes gene_type:complete
MTDKPKIVVNNTANNKKLEIFKLKCGLYGERDALVNLQTDIWEKIELVNKKILLLEPKKKKRYTGSNVY